MHGTQGSRDFIPLFYLFSLQKKMQMIGGVAIKCSCWNLSHPHKNKSFVLSYILYKSGGGIHLLYIFIWIMCNNFSYRGKEEAEYTKMWILWKCVIVFEMFSQSGMFQVRWSWCTVIVRYWLNRTLRTSVERQD